MSENKLTEMINLYFDGELEKGKEPALFSLLSGDQGAREYFKQLNIIRSTVENSEENLPADLEERILRSVGAKQSVSTGLFSNIKIFSAITYAAAIVLLFLSGYLFFKVSNYQERVENLSQQMIIQTRTIDLLFNSLPSVEIRATSNMIKNEKPSI